MRIQDQPSNRELPAAAWLERLTPTGTDQECWSALMVLFSIDDPSTPAWPWPGVIEEGDLTPLAHVAEVVSLRLRSARPCRR